MKQRIIDVDLGRRSVSEREVPVELEHLGGRGLTSTLISLEVDPTVHPLSADNLLVIAPGLLAGSPLSSCNRLSAGAKSPLTGTIKEANSGGVVAQKLGRLGIKALVLRGAAAGVRVSGGAGADPRGVPARGAAVGGAALGLRISAEGVSFEDLSGLQGRYVYETAGALRERYGERAGFVITGPAGEMRLPAACLSVTDPEGEPCRNLGRGGLGAVAGSKGLKAIIVDDAGAKLECHDPEGLRDLVKRFTKALREHPVTGERFALYGTTMTLMNVNTLGGLPTWNFSSGSFEGAEALSGETLYETITSRGGDHAHACMPGCVIRCSNKYVDARGIPVVGSLDFETVCLLGANIGLGNLDQVAVLNKLCNDIGVDTMETGVALGVLAEAGVFSFGDFEAARGLIVEIGRGTPLGRLVGSGSVACGRAYGVERVPAVKGQGMAAYDPRAIKGMGLTYAMSPMGADHTAGNAITLAVDHLDPKAQLEPVRDLHAKTMVLDTLGACLFTARVSLAQPELLTEAVKVITGRTVSFAELVELGHELLLLERDFNRRAGFTAAHDRIPEFMRREPLEPNRSVYDVAEEDEQRFYR
jgi:aldehyde:ferredoxin oxidoreductase